PRVVGLARVTPAPVVMALRPLLAAGMRASSMRARVEQNMRAALGAEGFRREHVDGYFRHLADLIAFSLAVFKKGIAASGIEDQWIIDEPSMQIHRDALGAGKGLLMVCPHLVGHEIMT